MAEPLDRSCASIPLCVDLDGTLLTTDSLHDSLCLLLKTRPWAAVLAPLWVTKGKAQFKQRVASRVQLSPDKLAFDERVIAYIESAREAGQPVWLVSGCDENVAATIAGYLGLFDRVMASDGTINLTGTNKRDALCELVGTHQYDYIGNSTTDLPVWSCARRILVANASPSLIGQLARDYSIHHVFPKRHSNRSS